MKKKERKLVQTCSICKQPFEGFGNNPEPLLPYEQRCCNYCNATIVVPIRLFGVSNHEAMHALRTYGFTIRQRKETTK